MLPFIEIAAIAMTAAARHAAPAHQAPARHAPAKPAATRSADHAQACAKAHRSYNAKTDTYRDAHGKQRRCTR